jgi:hypothetical protein
VRKLLFILSLWLGVALWSPAETLTLTDGGSVNGDILKFDDNGMMLKSGDTYTNVSWARFSQDSLKRLTANPKIRPLVEVFIEPDVSQRPPKPEVQINAVNHTELPANPSLFGGLVKSPVGLALLLAIYLANLFAGYEVSIIRARPAAQVIGLSAIAPIIGPIVFLAMPTVMEKPDEEKSDLIPGPTEPGKPQEEIKIVEASWKQEEKKAEPQIFARGKFTFNKRFVETKFAGYIGAPKGDALKFSMSLKSGQGEFNVERIAQVGMTDVIFETAERGQVTVPLTDIQEIKLTPKPA